MLKKIRAAKVTYISKWNNTPATNTQKASNSLQEWPSLAGE